MAIPSPRSPTVQLLLRAAAAAPSMHNTQPWRFRIRDSGTVVELRADPARTLPVVDPHGRAVHIACGTALLNLRVAAAAAGLDPDVRVLPDPGQPLLMAEIGLTRQHRATCWEREMKAAIFRRQTNREPFSSQPVPPGVRAELAEAAAVEGAALEVVDREEAERLLHLVADAERCLLADPAYRAELARWAGGPRRRDGIPDRALGSRSPVGGSLVRDFTPHRHAGIVRYAWFEDNPQLAVVAVRGHGPVPWLAAGQALARIWLTATCRGISACPLTQPLETADAWQVRGLRSASWEPQMILRIGYGLPISPGSARRPVAELIDES